MGKGDPLLAFQGHSDSMIPNVGMLAQVPG